MLEDVVDQVICFRDERDWKQFHNPKDLAISICLEAAELLENFQWTGNETDVPEKKVSIVEELADVLIYSIMMADVLHVDVNEIIKEKLKKNGKRYQVEKAYGSKKNIQNWVSDMIIYQNSALGFRTAVDDNKIVYDIDVQFMSK